MSLKKGINNFKNKQLEIVALNTQKIKDVLKSFKDENEKIALKDVIYYVAKNTNLHITTIKKNKSYIKMCEDYYNKICNNKNNKNIERVNNLESEVRILELKNANLENEIIRLKNLIMEKNIKTNKATETENNYEECFNALLNHFKSQIVIKDNKVIDPYTSIREKTICIIKKEE